MEVNDNNQQYKDDTKAASGKEISSKRYHLYKALKDGYQQVGTVRRTFLSEGPVGTDVQRRQ